MTSDQAPVGRIREISRAGWEIEVDNDATGAESTEVTRIGADEVAANPDGLSRCGAGIEVLRLTGLLSPQKLPRDGTLVKKQVGIGMHPINHKLSAGDAPPGS